MSETKLKCCPFCGGEAKYMEIKDFFISRFVTCTKCGIETPRNCLNRKEAIKRWNTRKPMDNIVAELENFSLDTTPHCNEMMREGLCDGISDCDYCKIQYAIDIVRRSGAE